MTTDKPGQVFALIPQAMAEIGAIRKTQTNKFDRYQFRGIDDLYNALHGPLSGLGLFIVPHEVRTVSTRVVETQAGKTQLETTMVVQYRIYGPDGSYVQAEAEGVGMDRGDKASNKAQTAAFKVLCFQVFMPPIEDGSDSEKDSPERGEPTKPKTTTKPKPARQQPTTVSTGKLGEARAAIVAWVKAHRDAAELAPDAVGDADFLVTASTWLYGAEGANSIERVQAMRESIEGGAVDLNTGRVK